MPATQILEQREVTISRTFDAPQATVFGAWTDPKQFAYWFGAELKVELPSVDLDVRTGGRWRAEMTAPDGSKMPFSGSYAQVTAPERIVMVFEQTPGSSGDAADFQTLTANFRDLGDQTKLTLHHSGRMPETNVAALDGGYNDFLDRMAELFVPA